MIVKDESAVIKRCLDCVKPYIDYWVIVDTGSKDGTQKIIKDYLKGIPGELYERAWRNYGDNRTEALHLARGKGDYLLFIDADDLIEFEKGYKLPALKHDLYNMWRGPKGYSYIKPQLVKNNLPWEWVGVTHEYLSCGRGYWSATLDHVRYVTLDDSSSRAQGVAKFLRNAELLEEGLKQEPGNTRYAFYLGESYRDACLKAKALVAYQKHTRMKDAWDQEVFWSLFRIAHLQQDLGFPLDTVIQSFYKAHRYRPHRIEPIYFLAEIYNQERKYDLAYACIKSRDFIPKPSQKDDIFNFDWIEEYGLSLQLSICTYYLGHYEESLRACERILAMKDIPDNFREAASLNRSFALEKLKAKSQNKKEETLASAIKRYHQALKENHAAGIYNSLLSIARAEEDLQLNSSVVKAAYQRAENACPSKVEALFHFIKYLRKIGQNEEAFQVAERARKIGMLEKFEEGILWEYSLAAWSIGKFPEAIDASRLLLAIPGMSQESQERLKKNISYYNAGVIIFDFAQKKWGPAAWEGVKTSVVKKKISPQKKPQLHICTTASHRIKNLDQLVKSAEFQKIKLDIVGLGETFSFGKKLRDFHEYVKKVPKDDVVLFLDAYDTLLLADERTILDQFLKMEVPIVVSVETSCHPFPHLMPYYPASPTKFKYINSGSFIGYARDLLKMFEEMSPIPDETDDQGLLTVFYLYHPERMKLDFLCDLFLPLYQVEQEELELDPNKKCVRCKTTSTFPCVIHGNGASKDLYQSIYDQLF